MSAVDYKSIVREYTDASVANDPARIRALYTDDFKLWHNFTGIELDLERALEYFVTLRNTVKSADLEIIRLIETPHGAIRECLARGETADGRVYAVPYICHFQINEDGKIYRIDEYLDSAAFAPMYADGWVHETQA
jgi:ketosteroid isomerase-like protein